MGTRPPKKAEPNKLRRVNTRLFEADVAEIQRRAAERGIDWQIELRLLVRHALRLPAINLLKE